MNGGVSLLIILELLIFSFILSLLVSVFLSLLLKLPLLFRPKHLKIDNLLRLTGSSSKYTKYLDHRKIKFVLKNIENVYFKNELFIEIFIGDIDTKEYLLVEEINLSKKFLGFRFMYFNSMRQINTFLKNDLEIHNKAIKEKNKILALEYKMRRKMIYKNRTLLRKKDLL